MLFLPFLYYRTNQILTTTETHISCTFLLFSVFGLFIGVVLLCFFNVQVTLNGRSFQTIWKFSWNQRAQLAPSCPIVFNLYLIINKIVNTKLVLFYFTTFLPFFLSINKILAKKFRFLARSFYPSFCVNILAKNVSISREEYNTFYTDFHKILSTN